jgi:hypothetical protein
MIAHSRQQPSRKASHPRGDDLVTPYAACAARTRRAAKATPLARPRTATARAGSASPKGARRASASADPPSPACAPRRITDECSEARRALRHNREKLDAIVTALLARESLDEAEIYAAADIARPRSTPAPAPALSAAFSSPPIDPSRD